MPDKSDAFFLKLLAAAMLATAPLAAAKAAGPGLVAQPPATAISNGEARSGVLQLAGGAYAYLPKGHTAAPAPVLVALHGAGGQAADTSNRSAIWPTPTASSWSSPSRSRAPGT